MSQFNQGDIQSPKQEKDRRSLIYMAVILVLLTSCIYLAMSRNRMTADNAVTDKRMNTQIDSIAASRASLQTDFEAASVKVDQLVSQNSKMDSALNGKKTEIVKLQSQIRRILNNIKATERELKEAKDMIASLTDKTREYEVRIAELEKENSVLTGKNDALAKAVDSEVTENVNLKKVASVLHASNLRLEPIHLRRNGKEKETAKAKRVDVLRIKFDIDDNRIAESGNKQMYIRIVSPDGNVLSSKSNVSGTLTGNNGSLINYSVMKEVALAQNQPVRDVSVDWNQDGNYIKGNYTIEIYDDGYKVGGGNVALR